VLHRSYNAVREAIDPGEWLIYTVNVASAWSYTADVRVASEGQGGTFHIEAGGADQLAAIHRGR
jgi:hypothetical protein